MKTKEELNKLKKEVETLNKKLKELTEEELNNVVGGQSNYNAQNGRSMMKVAEVDCNQKEIDASIQQIDDNALLTFNGKILNNGQRTCKQCR